MPVDLSKYFVIGIASRALFDLSKEDQIFETVGLDAYSAHQIEKEDQPLAKGAGFDLIEKALRINKEISLERPVEVVVMSRNSADTALRIFNSIDHHGLEITRAALTDGASLAPYLGAFDVDLFLSASSEDVQSAANSGFAAGLIYPNPCLQNGCMSELRIAFDGDAVLFSSESEEISQKQGLEGFQLHEKTNARRPMSEGPMANVLRVLAKMQEQGKKQGKVVIRTALVTARNRPAHERAIRTLREWGLSVNEAFFLGGVPKDKILKAFQAHIFFDDQETHCVPASKVVPTARVLGAISIPAQRELRSEGDRHKGVA